MPVLRAAVEREPLPTRPVAWEDVRRQAERIVEEARAEAARILAEARAGAERLSTEARARAEAEAERGRARLAEAEQALEAKVRAEWEAKVLAEGGPRIEALLSGEADRLRGALASASESVRDLPARLLASAEARTVALAVEAAELLVRRELSADPALVAGSVRAALEALAAAGPVAVRLHPDDKARIERDLPRLLEGLALAHPVALEADPSVTPGGCRAAAAGATADATVEGQLAALRKALLGEGAP